MLQPGTYVRPHRHAPGRFELFVLLDGAAAVLAFDDAGTVIDRELLQVTGTRVVEIPGGTWHGLVALSPDTVLFEVKPGPYEPQNDKQFADWAPAEGDPSCAALVRAWTGAVEGT